MLVGAAVTKTIGGLNNKHLFPTVLKAERSKVKVLAGSVSSEGVLPGLQITAFLLCLHIVQRQSCGLLIFL